MAPASAALCRPFWAEYCNYVIIEVEVSLYLTDYLKSFSFLQSTGSVLANLLALCTCKDMTRKIVLTPFLTLKLLPFAHFILHEYVQPLFQYLFLTSGS